MFCKKICFCVFIYLFISVEAVTVLVEEGFVSAQHQVEYLQQLAAFSLLNKVSVVMWKGFVSAQHQVEYLQQLAAFSLINNVSEG